jgi:hypothetical protein
MAMPVDRPMEPVEPSGVRPARLLFVLLALCHLTGGHWGILQGVAWAKMLADYSSESGWVEGARKTFDGKHPCDLCRSIAASKEQESDPSRESPAQLVKSLSFKDFKCPEGITIQPPPARDHFPAGFVAPACPGDLTPEGPALPPPRSA